ncbi:MAG: hypothetical protein CL758_03535 [Chloroflexi bacterium]|nr:hypothetical protein [Chloroflexota bacterium]|tara:strand:- start:8786 stop:9727 length:942 start_codon:yes stop_codon:yes gene_type:complete
MWPNFFIVGGIKCGSTFLYQYLGQHEEILMSKIKEPSYFSIYGGIQTETIFSKPKKGFKERELPKKKSSKFIQISQEDHTKLFESRGNEKIFGEATPHYLFDESSPKLIHEKCPDAKILISLRNPIDRCYSWYLSSTRTKVKQKTFEQIIKEYFEKIRSNLKPSTKNTYENILLPSFYYDSVRRYLELFGKDKIKIIIFEECFPNNILNTINEILNFLDIKKIVYDFDMSNTDGYFTPNMKILKLPRNPLISKIGRHIPYDIRMPIYKKIRVKDKIRPKINETERSFLKSVFKSDVMKLEKLLNKKIWDEFNN